MNVGKQIKKVSEIGILYCNYFMKFMELLKNIINLIWIS
jgi:hypothetical protein